MATLNDHTDQLLLPFKDLIENLGVPDDYDFEALKNFYLPDNPLMDFPLFLPAKSKVVTNSRIRYRHLKNKKNKNISPPNMSVNDLMYKVGSLTISGDMDYGLPDEFDGEVFDCILMLISKLYSNNSKTHLSYRIDEMAIMHEFEKRGYKPGGSLYQRIKDSLDRLKHTSYKYFEEVHGKGTETNYIQMAYNLISELYRRGEKHPDGKEVSHTMIVPNSVIVNSIKNKEYRVESNEVRYQLQTSFHTKKIFDRIHKVVSAQILSREIYIPQKANTLPFNVIDYHTFCNQIGLIPQQGTELKASIINRSLKKFRDDLVEKKVLVDLLVEKKKTVEKRFKLIFIVDWNYVDVVFGMMNRSMNMQNLDKISPEIINAYFGKMETMISTRSIINIIKKRNKPK